MVSESNLYMYSSIFAFTAFLTALKFLLDPLLGWAPKQTWSNLPYGTYPIVILGFLASRKVLNTLKNQCTKQNKTRDCLTA